MLNNTVAILILVLGQASGNTGAGTELSLDLPSIDIPPVSGSSASDKSGGSLDAAPLPGIAPAKSGSASVPPDRKPQGNPVSGAGSVGSSGSRTAAPASAETKRGGTPSAAKTSRAPMIPAPSSMVQKTKQNPPADKKAPSLSSPGGAGLSGSMGSGVGASSVSVNGFNDPLVSSNFLNTLQPNSPSGNSDLMDLSLRADQGKGHIMPLDQVEIPAQEAGTLTKVYVREGLIVEKGQTLAQIEDDQVKMAEEVQRCKLLAAEKEASNDVNIRYSKAASAVADAEVLQAKETNARVPGAVPSSEVRRLELALVQTKLQIEQAEHQYEVAKITVDVQKAEYEAAILGVKRRQVLSPIGGVVVEKYRNEGEWVRPGDPILKIIYLERLRAKTTLDINRMPPQKVINHKASVELAEIANKKFTGRVVFVNPIIQPGGSYEVWVEVNNEVGEDGFWFMQPGMNATITILPEKEEE